MSCICCSTVPVVYHGVTRSWGAKASGTRLVLCLNCNGEIERSPTAAVLELRRRERIACAVPLADDVPTPWTFPSDAAIAASAG
jgi:hypothetical protein